MMKHTSMALFAMLTALGCASTGPVTRPSVAVAPAPVKVAVTAVDHAAEPAGETASPAPSFAFAHVIHDGGVRLLLDGNPDDAWAAGAPKLVSKGSPVVARRDV